MSSWPSLKCILLPLDGLAVVLHHRVLSLEFCWQGTPQLFTLLNHNSVVVECVFQACHFRTPELLFFSGKHDPKPPSIASMLTGSSPTLELPLTYRHGMIAGYLAPRSPFVLSVDIFFTSNYDFDSWFARDQEKIFLKNNSLMQTLMNKCSRRWNGVQAILPWGEKMASTQNFLYPANAVVFLFVASLHPKTYFSVGEKRRPDIHLISRSQAKFPLAFHAFLHSTKFTWIQKLAPELPNWMKHGNINHSCKLLKESIDNTAIQKEVRINKLEERLKRVLQ